ncbi:MAG: hypothetical protein RIQ33_2165, partial [Bacteroidota bacterium]
MPLLFKIYCAMMLHYTGSIPSQIIYQNNYPSNYFQLPFANEIELAGTFGELRPNHFHSGWDIKTNNQQGYPVHAVQVGFISRIKLSNKGYGLAIYITHPNGFTSVYAHLKKLNKIGDKILQQQLMNGDTDQIDIHLPIHKYKIKKDEIIAFSGNSGSSEAPHLHFEIRDAFTEEAINPIFFNLNVNDTYSPIISKIGIYEWAEKNQASAIKSYAVSIQELLNKQMQKMIVVHQPIVSIAINGFDKQFKDSKSKLGFTEIELLTNKNKVCTIDFDRLIFAESKNINFMLDSIQYKKHNV